MTKTTTVCLAMALAIFLTLPGCAGNIPQSERMYVLEDNWGRSVKTANRNQTLNPTAGLTQEPVVGADGNITVHVLEKHRETFTKEHRKDTRTHRKQVQEITR